MCDRAERYGSRLSSGRFRSRLQDAEDRGVTGREECEDPGPVLDESFVNGAV